MIKKAHTSRLTTSQCKSISVKLLKKHLYFFRGGKGSVSWSNFLIPGKDSIGFFVSMSADEEHVRFVYGRKDWFSKEKVDLDYVVKLTPTRCFFGGRRWWLRCPLEKDGQVCNRRVGILYLGGGNYFGCRHCYRLAYESSQNSHRFNGPRWSQCIQELKQ